MGNFDGQELLGSSMEGIPCPSVTIFLLSSLLPILITSSQSQSTDLFPSTPAPRCLSSPLHIHHPPTHLVVVLNPNNTPTLILFACLVIPSHQLQWSFSKIIGWIAQWNFLRKACSMHGSLELYVWIASQLVHILLVSITYCLFPFSTLPHTHYNGIQLSIWLPELLNWCTFFFL